MSLVSQGLGLDPAALVGPAIWGYGINPAAPPPATTAIDPFAKHANTQVIRESHLKKYLKGKQKKRKLTQVEREIKELLALEPEPAKALFGHADARHIEKVSRLIAQMAIDEHYIVGSEDLKLLKSTPAVLKKIH